MIIFFSLFFFWFFRAASFPHSPVDVSAAAPAPAADAADEIRIWPWDFALTRLFLLPALYHILHRRYKFAIPMYLVLATGWWIPLFFIDLFCSLGFLVVRCRTPGARHSLTVVVAQLRFIFAVTIGCCCCFNKERFIFWLGRQIPWRYNRGTREFVLRARGGALTHRRAVTERHERDERLRVHGTEDLEHFNKFNGYNMYRTEAFFVCLRAFGRKMAVRLLRCALGSDSSRTNRAKSKENR